MKRLLTRGSVKKLPATVAAVILCLGEGRGEEPYTMSDLSIAPPLSAMSGGDFAISTPVVGDGPMIAEGGGFRMEVAVTPLPPPIVVLGDAEVFITVNGAEAVVTWTAAGTGYVLESTPALGELANWQPVSPAPTEPRFTAPLQGVAQFFRLRRP